MVPPIMPPTLPSIARTSYPADLGQFATAGGIDTDQRSTGLPAYGHRRVRDGQEHRNSRGLAAYGGSHPNEFPELAPRLGRLLVVDVQAEIGQRAGVGDVGRMVGPARMPWERSQGPP
jgi:hypothetical protein